MNSTQMQYRAFLAVVVSMLIVALSPLVVSGIRGVALPDALIAIADKSTTAFGTLLGTIGALLFRQSRADEQRVDNTTLAFEEIRAARASTPGTADGAIRDGDSVTIDRAPTPAA